MYEDSYLDQAYEDRVLGLYGGYHDDGIDVDPDDPDAWWLQDDPESDEDDEYDEW